LASRWAKGSCNANVYGVEVVPPLIPGPWSKAATDRVLDLLGYLTDTFSIPFEEDRIITHSDAHPISRTTRRDKPWDPPQALTLWKDLQLAAG